MKRSGNHSLWLRRTLISALILSLGFSTVACSSGVTIAESPVPQTTTTEAPATPTPSNVPLVDGTYPVQQVTYDDGGNGYTVFALDTPASMGSRIQFENLPMARLTDEEIASGQKSYLKVENGQPSLHLTEDFRIEYVHNVTETAENPQTGQVETVVVRQEPSFWTPFAGALAGQALGSLIFRPQYYFPPVYQPGIPLVGYGGYGSTYGQAVQHYRTRYSTPPVEVRNRQFRATGQLRSPSSSTLRRPSIGGSRSTGSGYGTSTLRRRSSGEYNRSYRRSVPRSFGSGGRARNFGRRR
jgi:hypothetical protein